MGWITYTNLDSAFFKSLYDSGVYWGDIPITYITREGKYYYVARITGNAPTGFIASDSVALKTGVKNRIDINYYYQAFPNSGQTLNTTLLLLLSFYRDSTTLRDSSNNNAFGIAVTLNNVTTTLIQYSSIYFEQDGKTIKIIKDNNVLDTIELNDTPNSFKVVLKIDSISNGISTIGVMDVIVSYYDVVSDIINMFMQIATIAIPLSLFGMMISSFRITKKRKEQTVTEEKTKKGGGG